MKLLQFFVFVIVLNVKFYLTSFLGIDTESGSQTELRTVVKSIELFISIYIRILLCDSSFQCRRSGVVVLADRAAASTCNLFVSRVLL
jgi:hypothetical protein